MTNAETNDKAATVAAQGAPVAPEKTSSKQGASKKKGAPKAKRGAKTAAPKKEAKTGGRVRPQKGVTEPRTNKRADVIAMMKRTKGVTLADIMKTTGWQAHTVRGFVSILGSKGGEKIDSSKNATGERTYHIAK